MTNLDEQIRALLGDGYHAFADEHCGGDEDRRCDVTGFSEMRTALIGVLDEHRPTEGAGPRECGKCTRHRSVKQCTAELWPCPTVRAIAKALGVEVDS